jgi:hypothetical protein
MVTRKRTIYHAQAEKIQSQENLFKMHLKTEAGTYVKEFIHSDFGRTRPSLADILGNCRTDILQLDVTVSFRLYHAALTFLFIYILHFIRKLT